MKISITDAVQQMRDRTNVSMSSFDDGQLVLFEHDINAAFEPTLAKFLNLNGNLNCASIGSRVVILPIGSTSFLHTNVSRVAIRSMSRAEAAAAYFDHLRTITNDAVSFDLSMVGKLNIPMYDDLVSLSPENSLLEHLVELLGTDQTIAFSSRLGTDGHWHFWFS